MASITRLTLIVADVENKIKVVEERVRGTEGAVCDLDRRVDKLENSAAAAEERLGKQVKGAEENLLEELEDRELRKLNVVFHGVGECPAEAAAGAERIEWDKQSCQNIFAELCLSTTMGDIKFCRRLGERREGPRPLLVGFHTEGERSNVLRNAPRLERTKFSDVQVVPDLTKRQRERESGMRDEAQRRNESLSEDDKAKNLQWAVVGGRGERRLIKTTARQQNRPQGNQRDLMRGGRGRGPTRGAAATRGGPSARGTATRGVGRPSTATRGGAQAADAARRQVISTEEEEEYPSLLQPETTRERRGSKRAADNQEEEMELEGRPPEKR